MPRILFSIAFLVLLNTGVFAQVTSQVKGIDTQTQKIKGRHEQDNVARQ
jgi:hypothetical protein